MGAALMRNKGQVMAFDRDPVRLKRLKANANLTGANIEACCQDFLQADMASGEFMNVQGVILDPSCSGSGTVSAFSTMKSIQRGIYDISACTAS